MPVGLPRDPVTQNIVRPVDPLIFTWLFLRDVLLATVEAPRPR